MSTKSIDNFEPFEAYKALGRAPLGAEPFSEDTDGNLVVTFSERYCRVALKPGSKTICGANFQSTGALCTHIKGEKGHDTPATVGGPGRSSATKTKEAKEFYVGIMEKHESLVPKTAAAHAASATALASVPNTTPKKKKKAVKGTLTKGTRKSARKAPKTAEGGGKAAGKKPAAQIVDLGNTGDEASDKESVV